MIVLLPPSESKATRRRGARLDLAKLSFPELTEARQQVAAAVSEVSARDEAPEVLGVSPNLADATRRVVISSSLYGAVRLGDRLAPYRLSMGVNLPPLGALAAHWRSVLDAPLSEAAGKGVVVDCRSSTYAASWTPSGELARRWVHIRVPGATHMAKHTRGLVTRALVTDARDPRTPKALAAQLAETFDVDLHEATSPSKPWILDVSVREATA